MEKYVIYPEQSIKDISEAIKEKRGIASDRNFTVSQMPAAIRAINSGGGSSSGGAHRMTFDIFTDYSNLSGDERDCDGSHVFISEEHYNEILEYYAAGYQVIITSSNNGAYALGVSSSQLPETSDYHVAKVFENLYDGPGGGYSRYSGAAIIATVTIDPYENQSDGNHAQTLIIRNIIIRGANSMYVADGDGMYYY